MKISLISLDAFSGSLGLRSISAYLKNRGHDARIVFLLPNERTEYGRFPLSAKILDHLLELAGDSQVIGISGMTFESRTCVTVIDHLKRLNKPIVWGGIHATSSPDECIKYADIVCVGEGEEAFCELVEAMENKEDYYGINNFWFKKDGGVIKNPVRPLLQDLDSLPIPDYDPESHFISEGDSIKNTRAWYKRMNRIIVHSARGCPNSCSYCINSFLKGLYSGKGKFLRSRSPASIINELLHYKAAFPHLKSFFLTEDTMFARRLDELSAFAQEYKKKIGLPFVCYTSPNTCQEDKLNVLLDAGLHRLQMGIQTGSERTNKDVYERNIPNSLVIKSAGVINKYSSRMAPPDYHVIFCNPYDRDDDLVETVSLVKKLPAPFILTAFQLAIFPASGLYTRANREGILKNDTLFNLCDYSKVLLYNASSRYMNFILFLMNGKVSKAMIGSLPRFLINFLIRAKTIRYFAIHRHQLSFLMGIVLVSNKTGNLIDAGFSGFKHACKKLMIK